MKHTHLKRTLALLLALVLIVGALPMAVSATSRTADQAIAWANSKVGQSLDYDGQYGSQCVDFIMYYYQYLGVSPSGGNGKDYAWNTLPSGWTRIQGGTPQKGDILVYGASGSNEYGHVAIYESERSHYHQNFNWSGKVSRETYRYNGLSNPYWGYIRPNWAGGGSSTPSPQITLDNPWLDYRSETNAVVHSVIRNNGAAVGCDKYNFKIWEKYSGKLLKTYSEDISHLKSYDHNDIWLDIATETGLYLSPNTAYQCQFSAEKSGKIYSSSKFEFITKHSSSEDSKKPANVKLTASTTECEVGDTVTLNFSVTDGISAKGARYFQLLQNGSVLKNKITAISTSVTLSKEGKYRFTLRAVNDVGSADSNQILITVLKSASKPENPDESEPEGMPVPSSLRLDKTTLKAGEPITGQCIAGKSYSGPYSLILDYKDPLGVFSTQPFSLNLNLAPGQHTLTLYTQLPTHAAVEMGETLECTVIFTVLEETATPNPERPTQFADVTVGQFYVEAVKWAVENNITSGTDKTHFSPSQPCTRSQAVTFLWRAAGSPEPVGTGEAFSDVAAGSYYEKAVQWAVEQGITSGTGNGKFSPNARCTRAQIVTFQWRAAGSPSAGAASFMDISAGQYYEEAVAWAVEAGITSGTGNNKFSPEQNCTRAQIVTFLYRDRG